MNALKLVALSAVLALAGAAVTTPLVLWWVNAADAEPLPVLGDVPEFELTDADGTPLSREDLDGSVWVASFIFTSCAGPCPHMTQHKAEIHEHWRGDDQVRFVSITVDPDRDTPEVMAGYADLFEADRSIWHFLTGPQDAIHSLAVEGFRLGSLDDPVFHSTRFVLVDGEQRIRGYYDGLDFDALNALARDIGRLRQELGQAAAS